MNSSHTLSRSILLGILALSTAGLLSPSLFAAGKGASALMFNNQRPAPVAAASSASHGKAAMNCARCVDGQARVTQTKGKGMAHEYAQMLPVHLCPACQTKIVAEGMGKAKTERVSHSCGNMPMAGSSGCCASNK